MDKTVRFPENVTYRRDGKPDIVYEAGKEYPLREDRARKWIARGKAVEVRDEPAGPAKAATPAATSNPSPSTKLATGDVPSFWYDAAAANVVAGKQTADEAVAYIVETFKGEAAAVRDELSKRIEKLKPAQPAAAPKKADAGAPVDFSASKDSQAFLKGDDKGDGNSVAGSTDVPGKNSGGAGVGSGADTGRGRGGKSGGHTGAGNK